MQPVCLHSARSGSRPRKRLSLQWADRATAVANNIGVNTEVLKLQQRIRQARQPWPGSSTAVLLSSPSSSVVLLGSPEFPSFPFGDPQVCCHLPISFLALSMKK
ncbi:hypothetical protein KP509_01G090300 [Ceratopteris richardii]|uniref:Uncharacterized protein n=1 Tax=Ceratopteris richardii TaxID=49495 RepID=A0A8T2VNE9_CERRI|nr:hypothetical protein KP509_01G090300 [Ceratopteris richardii]